MCWTKPSNCHRWAQEETTDRRGQSHPPPCFTARDDRRIVSMAVMDRAATSRTRARQIQWVTHHSVSSGIIRRRLQQSRMPARHPLLLLPLNGNHRCLRAANGAMNGGHGQRNGSTLCLLTNPISACKSRWSDSSLETPW
ncbi:transposable element Tc1 transposase [Trichonephila clavipes]|nr:transposable element Tc1 transposase [Trichonephila clavipes]